VAAVSLFAGGCGGDDDTGGEGSESNSSSQVESSCELGGKGLELLAEHVHEGEPAEAVIASTILPLACNYIIRSVIDDPFKTVSVEVALPEGGIDYFSGTGEELISPAPPAEPTAGIDFGRLIECVKTYSIKLLVDACVES
jgi:hypothetical protein